MSTNGFDEAVDGYRQALAAFVTGDPEPVIEVFSRRDDATLANPLGPPHVGWNEVARGTREATKAANLKNGTISFEEISRYNTPELGYVLDLQRVEAQTGGSAEMTQFALRVTTIFRREDGAWKVVHRHADPITGPRDMSSVVAPSS